MNTREDAAETFVNTLSAEHVLELMRTANPPLDYDIEDQSDDELRSDLIELIGAEQIEPDDFEFNEDEARSAVEKLPI